MAALLLVFASLRGAHAQSSAPRIRTICVENFQGKLGAAVLRAKVIERLRALGKFQLVDNPSSADAVLHGTGELWVRGYLSASPHNPSSLREPVYGGYLSLQLDSPGGEVLWSYLVTPGRLLWKSAADDMADHIVRLMAAALERGGAPGGATPAASGAQLTLTGAGSTFAAPLYQDWIESFEEHHPEVHIGYQAVGSEEGIQLLQQGKVDFAGSDVALSNSEMAARHVHFDHVAVVLGAVVPAYNLPALGRDLRFTPSVLADIYLGKITRWNAPELRALNHGIALPDEPILVVHRSDGSGTTATFTAFLSATSPAWKSAVGSGMRVAWPTGEAAQGNDGVAAKVAATPGALGYMELTWAIRNQLSYGMVRNADGAFVQANLATLSAAAASAGAAPDLRASLVNASGHDAWPITTFTWILLPAAAENPQKTAALHDLLRWMLTAGQKECSGLGYLPLPKEIAERELRETANAPANVAGR
ncbi:MAG TPA: phosphate ABC transporter substrate-binding protein PstS [Acidobacteriaceae bacterium]|nr:phosphate ABC transporter substrate-binding protein PstS [Acidobacteriaceae bacterium]